MDFMDRLQKTINDGVETSKNLLRQARDKTLDLGDRGVLKFEIMQLENQAEKLMGRLGSTVYKAFTQDENVTITRNTPDVEKILEEIRSVHQRILEKENLLKKLNKKE